MSEQGWGRGRLVGILVGAVLAALALTAGLVFAVLAALDGPPRQGPQSGGAVEPAGAASVAVDLPADAGRDQVAAAPMLEVRPQDARSGQVSSTPAQVIEIPAATRTGPGGVPTGFPQSPQGAVAQLAAIDLVVLRSMSVPVTVEVHDQWSTGGQAQEWVMTQNVTAFLSAAGQAGQAKGGGLSIVATPAAGQVKGSDGPDWVLACVLLDVKASLSHEARMAYGHCEAMTWQEDRWVIESGADVAPAPSTWPGTDLAAKAGWRTWAPARPSHD